MMSAGPASSLSLRIDIQGLRKVFGPTAALDGVDLAVRPGSVHALIGQNGAGKSTLMRALSGAHRPDAGRMLLDGEPYHPADPLEARRRGVVMVYQERALAPPLSVAANIMLGVEPARGGWIRRRELDDRAAQALNALGHGEMNLGAPVSSLGAGQQQVVELARALVMEARLVALDEPTASLAADDVPRLFDVIRRLRRRGVSIVYITHLLEEVDQIADQFTVLRDGRAVASGRVGEHDRSRIIEWMVGRKLEELFPRLPHEPGEAVLEMESLGAPGVRSASLTLRRGEILGVAGLVGAGRTELLRAVFGLAPITTGRIRIGMVQGPAGAAERLAQGVGLLSEDRAGEGLAAGLSVAENLTLSRLEPYRRLGWLDRRAQTRAAAEWMRRLSVRARDPLQPVGALSGGNQQKVALARLLHHDCDVLLLDEPTRGIDVASKIEIYERIGRLAQAGQAILFVSSYLPELLGVCDTIAVLRRGRLGEKLPTGSWTEHSLLEAALGPAGES